MKTMYHLFKPMFLLFIGTWAFGADSDSVIDIEKGQCITIEDKGICCCPYMFYEPDVDYLIFAISETEHCYIIKPNDPSIHPLGAKCVNMLLAGWNTGHMMNERTCGLELKEVFMHAESVELLDIWRLKKKYDLNGCLMDEEEGYSPSKEYLKTRAKTWNNQYPIAELDFVLGDQLKEGCCYVYPYNDDGTRYDIVMGEKKYVQSDSELRIFSGNKNGNALEKEKTIVQLKKKAIEQYSCILNPEVSVFIWLTQTDETNKLYQWNIVFCDNNGNIIRQATLPLMKLFEDGSNFSHDGCGADAIYTPQVLGDGVIVLTKSEKEQKRYAYVLPFSNEIKELKSSSYVFVLPYIFRGLTIFFRTDYGADKKGCGIYSLPSDWATNRTVD